MTSESKQLTGLELRKACLIAAGWSVLQIDGRYSLRDANGEKHAHQGDFYLMQTEEQAWQIAPAVESSVDAALEYLTFPPNMQLDLNSPTYNGKLWYVELHFSPSLSPQYYAYEENPAVGICRVWLQWKTA